MDFKEVKTIVKEVDYLKEKIKELSSENAHIGLCDSIKNIHYTVDLENNTNVLIEQSALKMIEDVKRLLEYEIGERMKKLNTSDNEKYLR